MSGPLAPPDLDTLLARTGPRRLGQITRASLLVPAPPRYLHWDQLRHLTPPQGLDHSAWWLALKLGRACAGWRLPMAAPGQVVVLVPNAGLLDVLGHIDALQRRLSGISPRTLRAWRQRALDDEAVGSARLDGVDIDVDRGRELLRSGRTPGNQGERVVVAIARALAAASSHCHRPMTASAIRTLHEHVDPAAPPLHLGDAHWQVVVELAGAEAADTALHPLLRAALVHFVVGMHPAHGRLARALFQAVLLRAGGEGAELLAASAVLAETPARYRRTFQYAASDGNDATYVVDVHLRAVLKALRRLAGRLDENAAPASRWRTLLDGAGVRAGFNRRQRALLEHALDHPRHRYAIAAHQHCHGVTYQTARTDLLGLASSELFVLGKRGRAFEFRGADDLQRRLEALAAG